MKFRLLFILPTFLAFFTQAQTTGKLSGWVLDKNTQKPIAGVNVKLINTNFGTVTDSLGKYPISNPVGVSYSKVVISLDEEIFAKYEYEPVFDIVCVDDQNLKFQVDVIGMSLTNNQ